MGLFSKKYCDICGKKIGILGNKKLRDGYLCKDCASKTSPWFNNYKSSTVMQIKEQLAWREENRKELQKFNPSRIVGEGPYVLIDEQAGTFTVAGTRNFYSENPDILPLSIVIGVDLDPIERKTEVYKRDKDDNVVSYEPPRYSYEYDFYFTIYVNWPYYGGIKFRLNSRRLYMSSVDYGQNVIIGSKCRMYMLLGEEIRNALLSKRDQVIEHYDARQCC